MDTINKLLSLAKLRMQTRDVREWRQQAPLFLQLLRDLHVEEAQLLSQRLLTQYPFQDDEDEDVSLLFAQINMFVPGALVPLLPMLVARQQFYPGYLYLSAGEETCQQILALLHAPSQERRSHLLQALAWMGTEAVQAQFSAFRLHPPAWRSELFVPPENYSQEAGWELTEDGRRRDLYFSTSFELIPIEQADAFQRRAAEPTTGQECCAWCQRPLRRVLDLDLRDSFYPQCPACQQTMPFLGQVAFEDWDDGEGVFYLFLCLSCRKAATHYQQT